MASRRSICSPRAGAVCRTASGTGSGPPPLQEQVIISDAKCGSLSMPSAKELVMSKVETQITVNLPDGSQRSLDEGATCADLATTISQGLFRKSVGALLNGEIRDLYTPLAD